MPLPLQPYDRFGSALAAGDFNLDGKDDLAVGAYEYDTSPSNLGAGAVLILKGGANGLITTSPQLLTGGQKHGNFGFSLAAGNFGKTANADLAIGVPHRDNVEADAGAVYAMAAPSCPSRSRTDACSEAARPISPSNISPQPSAAPPAH